MSRLGVSWRTPRHPRGDERLTSFALELSSHGESSLVHELSVERGGDVDAGWEDRVEIRSSHTERRVLQAKTVEADFGLATDVADADAGEGKEGREAKWSAT